MASIAAGPGLLELNGHAPRRSNPDSSTLAARGGGNLSVVLSCAVVQSGRQPEVFAPSENGPAHSGVLGGDGDHGLPVAAPLRQRSGPAADRIALVLGGGQHRPCAEHQQAAQVRVTGLGDTAQALLAARAVLPGHQAEPGAELAAAVEVVTVADHRQ